jgi:hypothetical protein
VNDWRLGWVGPREVPWYNPETKRFEGTHTHMVVGPVPPDYDGEFYGVSDPRAPITNKQCISGECVNG